MAAGITFYGRRQGNMIFPVNEAGEDELARVKNGSQVRVTLVRERSLRQNRFFRALCHRVAKAMQAIGRDDMDKDVVADQLKIATGHCRLAKLPLALRRETGQVYGLVPKSIDFHSMDHSQFCEWLDKVIGFIVTELLPHIPAMQERDEILRILDEDERRAYMARKEQGSAA